MGQARIILFAWKCLLNFTLDGSITSAKRGDVIIKALRSYYFLAAN
jgi:hypothetical protein